VKINRERRMIMSSRRLLFGFEFSRMELNSVDRMELKSGELNSHVLHSHVLNSHVLNSHVLNSLVCT
jgi:hypothetical protein